MYYIKKDNVTDISLKYSRIWLAKFFSESFTKFCNQHLYYLFTIIKPRLLTAIDSENGVHDKINSFSKNNIILIKIVLKIITKNQIIFDEIMHYRTKEE